MSTSGVWQDKDYIVRFATIEYSQASTADL